MRDSKTRSTHQSQSMFIDAKRNMMILKSLLSIYMHFVQFDTVRPFDPFAISQCIFDWFFDFLHDFMRMRLIYGLDFVSDSHINRLWLWQRKIHLNWNFHNFTYMHTYIHMYARTVRTSSHTLNFECTHFMNFVMYTHTEFSLSLFAWKKQQQ